MHTWVDRCKTSILTSFVELTRFIKCVDKSDNALNFSVWNKFEATWILTEKQAQVYYQSRPGNKRPCLLSTSKNYFWYEKQIDLVMELLITLHLMEVQQNKSLYHKLQSWIRFLQTLNCKKSKTRNVWMAVSETIFKLPVYTCHNPASKLLIEMSNLKPTIPSKNWEER